MKLKRLIRKTLVALAILVAFGLAKGRFENGITKHFIEAKLIAEVPAQELGSMVGQSTFLAVLGGLRPLVAIYTTLHAFDAWSFQEWDSVERDYRIITTLMPEDIDSWKIGAWHLSYNAAASSLYDTRLPEAVALRNGREWIHKGIEFIKDGIEQNPHSAALQHELADIYRDKLEDHCLAAKHYKLSMDGDHPKSYARRFWAYSLSRCPGREREAYDLLMTIYHDPKDKRTASVIKRIKGLEEKLTVPAANRIPDPDPDLEIRRNYPNAKLPFDED